MRKNVVFLVLSLILISVNAQDGKEHMFQKWALHPPMGWNSWDCFGPSVVESEVKVNADYMAEHLLQFGWEYVVVDIRWYIDNQTTGHYNAYNNSTFILDEYGRYLPSPKRFPSSVNGAGFKPLGDYIHSKGLKFGIHIMRGVPRKAVEQRLPIKGGNGKTAADIYSTAYMCTWLQDNYTVVSGREGAQEYYNSIFDLYASWGVDFIKIDDISRPYHQAEIEMIRKAIDQCGRPMVLSLSPGETPLDKAVHVQNHANMWRTVDDFWDNWSQLNYQFGVCAKWAPYIKPGSWPDADMLPLGRLAIRGERGIDRQSNFTKDEQFTLMTLWSIFRSPLMFGGHMPDNTEFTKALITNPEVLQVNQMSVNNKELYNLEEQIAWVADDPLTGDKYLALFNNGGDGFVKTNNLLYRSGTISRLTDRYGVDIDIELPENSDALYLIVNDGGDGFGCDHANWIDPTIYLANGDSVKLTTLNWEIASAGWGTVTKNKSVSGAALNIQGRVYDNGIGTHAQSVIMYPLPTGSVRFRSFAGLDFVGTNQGCGSTVEFLVAIEDPTVRQVDVNKAIAHSGRISRTFQRDGKNLEANITKAEKLYLVVTDAGDNFNYDHANWINPTIYKENGDSLRLTTLTPVRATSGWGTVRVNRSLDNNPLRVNGRTYNNGFGVNSNSIIEFNLPEGYSSFRSFVGFDDEVLNAPNGVTVEFLVFTEDPSNNSRLPITVDLPALGFSGDCLIRDLWARKDSGMFSGNSFVPEIPNHGTGFYRLKSMNRSEKVEVEFSASKNQINSDDTINFSLTVQTTDGSDKIPTGSFVVYKNNAIVGVLPVDDYGKGEFVSNGLSVGNHVFRLVYSGNTLYKTREGNEIQVNVKDISSTQHAKSGDITITRANNSYILKGLKTGDQILAADLTGKVAFSGYAISTNQTIERTQNLTIIRVISENKVTVFKLID